MVEFLSRYVVVIIVAICYCLGYIIKNSLDFIPNKFIPLIMAIAGIILNVWLNNWSINPYIILTGIVSGLASTGTFEMTRNLSRKSQ